MTEDITAYALGLRHLSDNDDAEPIEAAFIPSIGVMPLTEAHALGAIIKRVAFLDHALDNGQEIVRYADMLQGRREQAERAGLAIENMPRSMRKILDAERAACEKADADFKRRPRLSASDKAEIAREKDRMPLVTAKAAQSQEPQEQEPLSSYAAALFSHPECALRPAATRSFLAMHGEAKPLYQSISIIAALPAEISLKESNVMTDNIPAEAMARAHAIIVRAAELRAAALELSGEHGDASAKAESRRLRNGLKMHSQFGANIVKALYEAGANVGAVDTAAKRAIQQLGV